MEHLKLYEHNILRKFLDIRMTRYNKITIIKMISNFEQGEANFLIKLQKQTIHTTTTLQLNKSSYGGPLGGNEQFEHLLLPEKIF